MQARTLDHTTRCGRRILRRCGHDALTQRGRVVYVEYAYEPWRQRAHIHPCTDSSDLDAYARAAEVGA